MTALDTVAQEINSLFLFIMIGLYGSVALFFLFAYAPDLLFSATPLITTSPWRTLAGLLIAGYLALYYYCYVKRQLNKKYWDAFFREGQDSSDSQSSNSSDISDIDFNQVRDNLASSEESLTSS
jgi:hypothetical protein